MPNQRVTPSSTQQASTPPKATRDATAATLSTGNSTPTPSLTPHPDAITPQNAGDVRQALVLSGHRGAVWAVALSPGGEWVASGGMDSDVRVWDAHSGEVLHVLSREQEWIYALGFTPDGARLVAGGTGQTLRVWDAASGEYLFGLRAIGQPFRLAFAGEPDGTRVAVASLYSARGQMWPLEPGAGWVPLEGHRTRLRSIAFSPDGRLMATGDEDGTVLLRDPVTGEPYAALGGGTGDAYGMAFSPDGASLAVGSGDGFVRLYDVPHGAQRLAWRAHAAGVWDVAFSADGALLASGGGDGLLILWDAQTGEVAARVGGHQGVVRSVDFAPGGSTLASGGDDSLVRLWRAAR